MRRNCVGCGVEIEGEPPEIKSDPDTLTFLIPLCLECFAKARKRIDFMTHAKSN